MLAKDQAELMLKAVAEALGPELLSIVAFVGRCKMALHVSLELGELKISPSKSPLQPNYLQGCGIGGNRAPQRTWI